MKIFILTSTRADFGLLKNLILEIKKDKFFSLNVIASGTHFSHKYGYTYNEIKENKIKVTKKIISNFNHYNSESISKVMSKCILESSKIFKRFDPDILILLGDRYEVLASSIAAHLCRIPVAHIHGGEVTQAAIDDAFRHSITKMSHIHFVANQSYKKRVIQLGENPKNIHIVGGLGIDSISKTSLMSRNEIEKKFKIKFREKNFLIAFHPETINKNLAKNQTKELLLSLRKLKNASLVFTIPGADLENEKIVNLIKNFIKKNKNAYFFKSLGQKSYFSFLKQVDGIIGNSSSGILEMPYFKKGTINIGERQTGRLMSKSIINVKIKKNKIDKAIKKLLSKNFKKILKKSNNAYGNPGATRKIIKILKTTNTKKVFNKSFFDIR